MEGRPLMKTKLLVAVAMLAVSAGATAAQRMSAGEFQARILAEHNRLRAAVGLSPLTWDANLAAGAEAWAQHMAATGVFDHSDRHARRGIGENIWTGSHRDYSPDEGLRVWESDRRNFVPGVFPNVSRTGNWYAASHYTQMIWPKTQRIGCGFASSATNDYLVCHYSPAGNIDGTHVP
jgi:hypothetical protein